MSILNSTRGARPFPIDKERQERCLAALKQHHMTAAELALHLGVSKVYISQVLSGRDISPATESRIAAFFGVPQDALFPRRTVKDIALMREKEMQEKQTIAHDKAERMAARAQALKKQGAD